MKHGIMQLTVALLAMLAITSCRDSGSDHYPVVVLGIDGAEWSVIESMIEAGELPHFKALRENGAWGRLINPGSTTSPVVWTTMATGHFAREHGIVDFVYPYSGDGGRRPVTTRQRIKPALWNIASHYGLESRVYGYFVSQPPESINGVIITPYAADQRTGSATPEGILDYSIAEIAELDRNDTRNELIRRFIHFPWEYGQEDDIRSPYQASAKVVRARNLDDAIRRDEILLRAARVLAENQDLDEADLYIHYFRMVDYMSHSLWLYYDNSDFEQEPDPVLQQHFGESIRESYRYVDDVLGELTRYWKGRANILVVSDHGFASGTGQFKPKNPGLTGNHRPVGIMLATGPDITPGEVRNMTIMEVAPTIAALMGVPIADTWPGRVEESLLRSGFLLDYPVGTVVDFSEVAFGVDGDSSASHEVLEQDMKNLQGLGYIGEGVDLDRSGDEGTFDFWSIDRNLLLSSMQTEIVYALINGDEETADELFAILVSKKPTLALRQLRMVDTKLNTINRRLPQGTIDETAWKSFIKRHMPVHRKNP